jgi:hypothetical protein
VRARAVERDVEGSPRRLPDATDALVLLAGHAQLQEEAAKLLELPLRALHDLSNLDPGVIAAAEWDRIAAHFRRAHASVALAGLAVAAAELFAVELPVATRGGREWYRATRWAADHERAAARYRELVSLPRALRADRMRALYGADHGTALARARAHHVAHGVSKRVRRG